MNVLIYGSTGYTGALIAQEAVRQGLKPILAGRSKDKLEAQAQTLGLEYRVFGLDDAGAVRRNQEGIAVLLNISGPFRQTAKPLVEACLHTRTHYLDIAGEVPEFEALAARDGEAQRAGIMLLSGVGFGVVPTDCLALHLKNHLPGATRLTLAFETVGGASRGTAETVLEDLPHGGVVRKNGHLVRAGTGSKSRQLDLGNGLKKAFINPWRGDVSTAYHTTGIGDIEAYSVMPAPMSTLVGLAPYLGWLLAMPSVHNMLKQQAARQPLGPSEAERKAGKTFVWGEAADASGNTVSARLSGPEAYDFTALSAVAIAKRVMQGQFKTGFQTPAKVFGADFVLQVPGVERVDV